MADDNKNVRLRKNKVRKEMASEKPRKQDFTQPTEESLKALQNHFNNK